MAATDKDTIYVDIDDEITTIIDKVRTSSGRIVALVLPKRATVFQSIVNMKLLKRAADSAKKRIVLITSEANLMPLAGAVGLHVAATPQSKPEVPSTAEPLREDDEEVAEEEYTADNAGDRPIGELAKTSGHVIPGALAPETVSLDDEEDTADDEGDEAPRPKRNRALHVPNFSKFRLRLFLGGFALIALIVGLYVATVVLPKAVIAISTNTSTINVAMTLNLDTAAQALDTAKLVVPAKSEQQQKTNNQQVPTTGEKNTGTAATGTVTMSAVACAPNLGQPASVPAGYGVSTNGLTFITQETTHFNSFGTGHGSCVTYQASAATDVTTQTGGTKYNVSNATFTVTGRSDVSATGTTSGGTDNIIKIVAQADIDGAKQKLTAQDTESIQTALEQALRTDGLYPLPATFNAGTPLVTTSSNVGDQADTLTVTEAVTYTMLGVKKADLDTLITQNLGNQIDTKEQTILDDGLATGTFTVNNTTATAQQVSLQTVATVGPSINPTEIKKQAGGKRIGDVKSMINAVPGVTSVDVRLSPFWVSMVPTDTTKITVTIDKK